MMSDVHILVTGLTALDIVYCCPAHPREGFSTTCDTQYLRKGGNAANTAGVLAQLNVHVSLLSTLADDDNRVGQCVKEELMRCGVHLDKCKIHKDPRGLFPTSVCLLSRNTGTRSVIHCRNNYPSLTLNDFAQQIRCTEFSWFHFEERCCEELEEVVKYTRQKNSNAVLSIELEKSKRFVTTTKALLPHADVIFVSKEIAQFLGYNGPVDAVERIKSDLGLKKKQIVMCPWGDIGAAAIDADDTVFKESAVHPKEILDTIGAGDTFIAAAIFYLSSGKTLKDTLAFSCSLAGKKCGLMGFEGLVSENQL